MDRNMLYYILYALAATDGREKVLFGDCAQRANEAFERSLVGDAFPEVWFELPLLGEPWFDLHVLTARETLQASSTFTDENAAGFPSLFRWFARREGTRQLALSHDVSKGVTYDPAVQLLVGAEDPAITCEFLREAGKPEAAPAYRAFRERLPRGWFACYAGVFPQRDEHLLRVECVPHPRMQMAYAQDGELLKRHLAQTGIDAISPSMVERCQLMARTPFALEFQFDVDPHGCARPYLGVSVRFTNGSNQRKQSSFQAFGPSAELMEQVEAWGLADKRWQRLAETSSAHNVTRNDQSLLLYTYPAFLKLRWVEGQPVDAKAYIVGGVK